MISATLDWPLIHGDYFSHSTVPALGTQGHQIDAPLDWALYHGSPLSPLVPTPYQVAINGRAYLINFQFEPFRREAFRHKSLPLMRVQADIGGSGISTLNNLPAEASLNPDGLWRRSQDNFWLGSGQTFLDRKDSNPDAYHTSKGINPWGHWQLTLQNDTVRIRTSANTNLATLTVGNYLYVVDGSTVAYTQAPLTGSSVFTTVYAGQPVSSICTDGHNIWFAAGADGLATTTAGSTIYTIYVTGGLDTAAICAYVKGRLMVGDTNSIYNITGTGALPTPLFTQGNTAFRWVAFAEGTNQIYATGYAGTQSLIYGTAVIADGTTLAAPIIYGQLPIGEQPTAMQGYVGFLLIGSNLGVRLATPDSTGVLTLGALILTPHPVDCFTPYNRWVWFGWTGFDTSSTGLGRIDLTHFTQPTTPAFASDLMAPGQGAVTGVAALNGTMVFGVAGQGFYAQTTTYVPSGVFTSGIITYDVADLKAAVYIDVQTDPDPVHMVTPALSLDGGDFLVCESLSAASAVGRQSFATPQSQASTFEVQLTLKTTDVTKTPQLYRHTLRALIAAPAVTEFIVPILLQSTVDPGDANMRPQNPTLERQYLEQLRQQRNIVTYQEGGQVYSVTVEGIDWLPDHPDGYAGLDFDGTAVLTLHSL